MKIFGPFLVKFRRLGGEEKFWGQMIVCQVLHDGHTHSLLLLASAGTGGRTLWVPCLNKSVTRVTTPICPLCKRRPEIRAFVGFVRLSVD